MSIRFLFLFLLFSGGLAQAVSAQAIKGEIIDMETQQPIDNVNIQNIHTNFGMLSDDKGHFFIAADKGQLLEFRKMGYKTVRVRIPEGNVPPYFKILMRKGPIELPDAYIIANRTGYQADSIRYHELYKHELDVPQMSALDKIQHPFTALSKHNREVWAFQKDYEYTQQQKYIDYTFNKGLVTKLTGLTGDSLYSYMRRFRPSYQQLRSMDEYTFYNFIKFTVKRYRYGSPSRLSN